MGVRSVCFTLRVAREAMRRAKYYGIAEPMARARFVADTLTDKANELESNILRAEAESLREGPPWIEKPKPQVVEGGRGDVAAAREAARMVLQVAGLEPL